MHHNESALRMLCDECQRLLGESQLALTNWNAGRAHIHVSGRRGREVDNELRTLQANFAKAWALLQYHEHDCEISQIISTVEGHSKSDARLQQTHH